MTTRSCCPCWTGSGSPGPVPGARGHGLRRCWPTRPTQRRIALVSPERSHQNARRRAAGSRGGRPPAFDAGLYKQRNVVERCFSRLKQFRDLATRYAKRSAYYQAELTIAAIILWLR